jgi:hypothetical protein
VLSIPLLFAASSEKSFPLGISKESIHMGLNQPSLLIYWGFFAVSLWQRQCSPEKAQMKGGEIPFQHWTIIIKLVINFTNCFEWRRPWRLKMGMKPALRNHNTSCFSVEQYCLYALFYNLPLSDILRKFAHQHEQDDTSPLGKSMTWSPRSIVSVTMLQNIVHCTVEYLVLNQILHHFVRHPVYR